MKTQIGHLRVSQFSDNNGRHDVINEDILILISGFAAPNKPLQRGLLGAANPEIRMKISSFMTSWWPLLSKNSLTRR